VTDASERCCAWRDFSTGLGFEDWSKTWSVSSRQPAVAGDVHPVRDSLLVDL